MSVPNGRAAVSAASVRAQPEARRLVVWPHHPDIVRRPAATSAASVVGETATWNIFRALQLLPPAFWLRRMNASLDLIPLTPAPITVDIRLWCGLQVPSGTVPNSDAIGVDVRIETEHALWALLVCHGRDIRPVSSDGVTDAVAMLAYAASWHAGRRRCYVGIVADDSRHAPLAAALVARYQLSRGALQLRMPRLACDSTNVAGVGMTTWSRLVDILRDASREEAIDPVERAIAARTVNWCDRVIG